MKTSFTTALFIVAIAFMSRASFAQTTGNIRGTVKSNDGKPASYVKVSFKEINKSALTIENGSYKIAGVQPGIYTLISSSIGLQTQEKTVEIIAGRTVYVDFVLAQSAAYLPEVIITGWNSANKKPVSIGKLPAASMDLPQSIAIIGHDIIETQQSQRLSDVVKNVNGVYLGTTRGSTQETFYARGYSFGSTNMFKNGSRINTGAMPEVSSLDRVEVLKGSAAILYGNVSPGGILNMVTKKP